MAAKASLLTQGCAHADSSGVGITGYKAVACHTQGKAEQPQGLFGTENLGFYKWVVD